MAAVAGADEYAADKKNKPCQKAGHLFLGKSPGTVLNPSGL